MTSTFHQFADLPAELRLNIWDYAVRPNGRNEVHWFLVAPADADRHENGPLISDRNISSNGYSDLAPGSWSGRSAYWWDSGLWTACWESRVIMLKNYPLDQWANWMKSRQDPPRFYSLGYSGDAYEKINVKDACFVVPRQSCAHERFTVVRPHHDLFCLGFPHKDSVATWGLNSQSPDGTLWTWIPQSRVSRQIALLFDPSWHDDWPSRLADLEDEKSARRNVLSLLEVIADNTTHYTLWLIDGDASVPEETSSPDDSQPPISKRRTFYDLDDEYVEIDKRPYQYNDWYPSEYVQRFCGDRRPLNASDFIRRLEILCEDDWISVETGPEAQIGPYSKVVRSYNWLGNIGILARRKPHGRIT